MAATTKDDVIEIVMLDVGDRSTDAPVKALYRTWFDDVLDMILARWPWLHRRGVGTIDVTAGDVSFFFPADVSEVRSLRISGTSRPLDYIDHAKLFNMAADLTTSGTPIAWYYLGYDPDSESNEGGLYPLNVADLTLEYDAVLQPPLPLADGDAIPLPREALGILREGIRAMSYENEGQAELALSCWQRFVPRLERLALSKGISRPEPKSRLREDGDLATRRTRVPLARFAPITE